MTDLSTLTGPEWDELLAREFDAKLLAVIPKLGDKTPAPVEQLDLEDLLARTDPATVIRVGYQAGKVRE